MSKSKALRDAEKLIQDILDVFPEGLSYWKLTKREKKLLCLLSDAGYFEWEISKGYTPEELQEIIDATPKGKVACFQDGDVTFVKP